jgi:hypothetical protein
MRRSTTVSSEQLEHPLTSAIVQGKARSDLERSLRVFIRGKSSALERGDESAPFNL